MGREMAKGNKNMAGYNREMNKEQMDLFLKALRRYDGNVTRACRAIRLKGGRPLVMYWKAKFPWFRDAFDQVIDSFLDEAEEYVISKRRRNLDAAKWLLSHHPGGRARGYGKRVETTGADGEPLVPSTLNLTILTKEERALLRELLQRRLSSMAAVATTAADNSNKDS